MPPSPQTPDAGDDDETVGRPSYDSITTTPRWRIDNLLEEFDLTQKRGKLMALS